MSENNKGLTQIAQAIVIIGFSVLSVWVGLETDWERGQGWAFLAVMVLLLA